MPNLIAHYLCGKIVCEKLKIKKADEFLFGCMSPDYNQMGHFRERKGVFLTPNLDDYMKSISEFGDYEKGNFCHYALDKIFLQEYVPNQMFKDKEIYLDLFKPDNIYRDYSIISKYLLEYFGVSLDDVVSVCQNKSEFDYDKFNKVIDEIKNSADARSLRFLNIESFLDFIKNSANDIAKQISSFENAKSMI